VTLASSGAALPLILRLSLRFHMGTRASDAGRAEPAFRPVVLIKCTNPATQLCLSIEPDGVPFIRSR